MNMQTVLFLISFAIFVAGVALIVAAHTLSHPQPWKAVPGKVVDGKLIPCWKERTGEIVCEE